MQKRKKKHFIYVLWILGMIVTQKQNKLLGKIVLFIIEGNGEKEEKGEGGEEGEGGERKGGEREGEQSCSLSIFQVDLYL